MHYYSQHFYDCSWETSAQCSSSCQASLKCLSSQSAAVQSQVKLWLANLSKLDANALTFLSEFLMSTIIVTTQACDMTRTRPKNAFSAHRGHKCLYHPTAWVPHDREGSKNAKIQCNWLSSVLCPCCSDRSLGSFVSGAWQVWPSSFRPYSCETDSGHSWDNMKELNFTANLSNACCLKKKNVCLLHICLM